MGLPRVTMKGPAPHRACCGHSEAWHLDMCDGHEQCAGCDCRTPTGTVDATPEHDLTPSEVALSKVLAAWVEWWAAAPSCGPDGDCMSDVGLSLIKRGVVNRNGTTSPTGAALLDRARRAGVL